MSTEAHIDEKIVAKVDTPKLWKVIFLNDDKTPMEFVTEVLNQIFRHPAPVARDITMEIHNTGSAVAGIYSFEIAEHKSVETTHLARANNFPLKIQIEEE